MVDRSNLSITIPATIAGLPAITDSLSDGISVNVTLTLFELWDDETLSRAFTKTIICEAIVRKHLPDVGLDSH